MASAEEIINWLKATFKQSPTSFTEVYYFDKNESVFFSIDFCDYFMFDENLEVAEGTVAGYSRSSVEFIRDKIRLLAAGDVSILDLPRFGDALTEEELETKIDSFLNINAIDTEHSSVWFPESGTATISLPLQDTTPISPPLPNKAISLFGRIRSFFARRYRLPK